MNVMNVTGRRLCGVDEAGRGPWAGPVVAAAVILPRGRIDGLDDSKKLSRPRREELFAQIVAEGLVGIGAASAREIERLNILAASLLAMRRAVARLPETPDRVAIDGKQVTEMPCPVEAIVGGDGRVAEISAASIVAKVTRDRIMVALSQRYPEYGWADNVGYGVPAHLEGLTRYGATPHHRRTFKPVHKILCG